MEATDKVVKYGSRRTFLARNRVPITLVAVVAALALAWLRGIAPHRPSNFRDPLSCAGSLLVIVGVLWRSWAAAVLIKGEVLATAGPYACCRHPLYLGSLAILVGYCLLWGDLWFGAVPVAAALATYTPSIVGEERRLAARFPGWGDYAQRVPALLPRRLPRGWGPVSWQRWRHNVEYRGAAAALLGLTGIELWHVLAR